MSRFVLVKELPEDLRKGEFNIKFPDFKEEIEQYYARMNNRFKITQINVLRNIFTTISTKYGSPVDYGNKIPFSQHEGIKVDTLEDMVRVVNEMIRQYAPDAYRRQMEKQLKDRPVGIKVCYFDGPFGYTNVFDNLGILILEEKDVDVELGLADKKVVGKPAVSGPAKPASSKANNKKSEDKTTPEKAN